MLYTTAMGGRIAAVLAGRCPRCDEGRIFAGLVRMHEVCPSCGLRFEREQGYFAGAMYISYALAVPIAAITSLALSVLFPAWSFERVIFTAFLVLLPLSPLVFRVSRILWIHFDRAVDP